MQSYPVLCVSGTWESQGSPLSWGVPATGALGLERAETSRQIYVLELIVALAVKYCGQNVLFGCRNTSFLFLCGCNCPAK